MSEKQRLENEKMIPEFSRLDYEKMIPEFSQLENKKMTPELTPEFLKRIQDRIQKLAAHVAIDSKKGFLTLKELKAVKELTQENIANILNIGQDSVSRTEARGDIQVSTLENYVKALGGELRLVAQFPDETQVNIMLD